MSRVAGGWIRSRNVVWILAFSSLAVAALILLAFRRDLDKAHVALVFLLVVLASSASGGRVLGVAIALTAFLLFDWFFLPPYNTLLVRNPLDWVVLVAFLITSLVAAELLYHQSLGGFFATLFSNATITDLWSSVLMCTMFGAIVAVVCSYKGMSASGGAAGVGRAVNQAVVISLVSVFAFQFVVSSVLLATNPELQAIR